MGMKRKRIGKGEKIKGWKLKDESVKVEFEKVMKRKATV